MVGGAICSRCWSWCGGDWNFRVLAMVQCRRTNIVIGMVELVVLYRLKSVVVEFLVAIEDVVRKIYEIELLGLSTSVMEC